MQTETRSHKVQMLQLKQIQSAPRKWQEGDLPPRTIRMFIAVTVVVVLIPLIAILGFRTGIALADLLWSIVFTPPGATAPADLLWFVVLIPLGVFVVFFIGGKCPRDAASHEEHLEWSGDARPIDFKEGESKPKWTDPKD